MGLLAVGTLGTRIFKVPFSKILGVLGQYNKAGAAHTAIYNFVLVVPTVSSVSRQPLLHYQENVVTL